MKLGVFLLFCAFSASLSATPSFTEKKWAEICRHYSNTEYEELQAKLSPRQKEILETIWNQISPLLPPFAQSGVCAKILLTERFEETTKRAGADAEKWLESWEKSPLLDPWLGMDESGCLLHANGSRSCIPRLSEVFQLKDPKKKSLSSQNPFLNYLTEGGLQLIEEFGAANCHGTADYLAGSFLKDTVLKEVRDWNITKRSVCRDKVEATWKHLSEPTIGALRPTGGVIVNMIYENCSEEDCGNAYQVIRSCDNPVPSTFAMIEGMCVQCWEKHLKKAGYLPPTPFSQGIHAGCIFTTRDHSITILKREEAYCYYFESTTSFASPLLRVSPCFDLSRKFTYGFCPN